MWKKINRNVVAYWLLGLCNNYGYVVMLSAAHDILKRDKITDNSFESNRHCNVLSTGVILLADVIPSLMVKIIAPFMPMHMNIRMILTVFLSALGFIIVAIADSSLTLTVLGVACTSASSGVGETSLLSSTVFYKRSVLSAFSSGTGGAGLFGSMTYAALVAIGLTTKQTLFSLLIVPVTMAISFWILLSPFENSQTQENVTDESTPVKISTRNFLAKMKGVSKAVRYIAPLTIVYYSEYLINQGLFELVLFDDTFIGYSTQYRVYQVLYQTGVFISRSSLGLIQIKKLWLLAALQHEKNVYNWSPSLEILGVTKVMVTRSIVDKMALAFLVANFVYFMFEAILGITPSMIIVFFVILWEGILGGLTYVNTFHTIQVEMEPEDREFITGVTSISDSVGVTLAGFSSIPLHNEICKLPKIRIF